MNTYLYTAHITYCLKAVYNSLLSEIERQLVNINNFHKLAWIQTSCMKMYTKYTILRRNSKESSKFCGKTIQLIAIFSDCILLSVYFERTKVLRKLTWRCNEILLSLAYLLYVRLDKGGMFSYCFSIWILSVIPWLLWILLYCSK